LGNLTIEILEKNYQLEKRMAGLNETHYVTRICLDDFAPLEAQEEEASLIKLAKGYPAFDFSIREVFGGFGWDLEIVQREGKAKYDALEKTKTFRQLYKELYEKYGVVSSAMFTSKLDEKMTDEEYDGYLTFYSQATGKFTEKD
jgi:hypothetical protein